MATQSLPITAGQTVFPSGFGIDGFQSSGIGLITITGLLTGATRNYPVVPGWNSIASAFSASSSPSVISVTSTVAGTLNIQGRQGEGLSPVPARMIVANLPTVSAAMAGMRAVVSDATAAYTTANVGSTVAGSGANVTPVYCNGVNWIIG